MVRIVGSTPEEERDAGYDFLTEISSNVQEEEQPQEEPEMSEDTMVEEKPKGLMAR